MLVKMSSLTLMSTESIFFIKLYTECVFGVVHSDITSELQKVNILDLDICCVKMLTII